ncbi:ammonium transporter [Chytriomyces cf. hyalinus JEL632]|nr:ammonium transporter [Chytriomyces cf. hyalinus JEL632]
MRAAGLLLALAAAAAAVSAAEVSSGLGSGAIEAAEASVVTAVDSGDIAWLLFSTSAVFIMIPGLGLFYAGLAESKNSLTLLHTCMLIFSVVAIQWALFGYSLAFSDTSNSVVLGNFEYAALLNTMQTQNKIAPTVPNSLWALYQMMAACITPALWLGATAGRMRLLPTMVFTFFWTTIVYDPIAYSVFAHNGWLRTMNLLDYAGGTLVHMTAGFTALVLALRMGRRVDYGERDYENHNPAFVYIGTGLLWFGWMGFDGGCSSASNSRAVNAALTNNLAAAMAGLVWMGLDTLVNKKKFSSIGYCTGAVAGMATMTAGSGFVQPGFGLIFGAAGSAAGFYTVKLFHYLRVDDSLDVTAVHAVGGCIGLVLTGIFAQFSVTSTDIPLDVKPTAGWVDRVWNQVPIQLLAIVVVAAWTIVWTSILLTVLNMIPGLHFRVSEDSEIRGLDEAEVGEQAYVYAPVNDKASSMQQSVDRTDDTDA